MNRDSGVTSTERADGNGRNSAPVSPSRDWFPRRQLPFWGLVGLTMLAVFFCYQLVQPFLSALLWAVAFAVLANPFYKWLCRKVRFRSLAAGISVAAVALVLVLPTVALAPKLAGDAASAVNSISKSIETGQWREKVAQVKAVANALAWVEANLDFGEVAREVAHVLTTGLSSVVKGSVAGVAQLLVSAFLLFYLFRDQEEALSTLRSLLPVTNSEAEMLFRRFSDTVYAIIYGKVLTAAAQGVLGGIGFWILGLPVPWFWGLAMGVLSFLPVVGASLVWGPAAVFLTLDGHIGRAVLLVVWGVVLVAPIEAFLYPIMVGHRLKLHNALVFIAVLGGLVAFGPVGLVVGPAILALTLGLMSLWKERIPAAPLTDARAARVESPTK
ncbi:MAG: AI-2E family transporter [Verrucomicrobia bacterium]|nr:AI-2E family transporter [Verrucomicrobiota bacterium]